MTRSGRVFSPLMVATALSKALVPSGSGGPLKPTCVSLSCMKENGAGASPLSSARVRVIPSAPALRVSAGKTL